MCHGPFLPFSAFIGVFLAKDSPVLAEIAGWVGKGEEMNLKPQNR
jgi:hypothetical protein